jgi:hypothetical protein
VREQEARLVLRGIFGWWLDIPCRLERPWRGSESNVMCTGGSVAEGLTIDFGKEKDHAPYTASMNRSDLEETITSRYRSALALSPRVRRPRTRMWSSKARQDLAIAGPSGMSVMGSWWLR